jgi:hypothetical protein
MPSENYFHRQAEMLLKFARQTRDPAVAAVLIDKAADLNEKVEDLPRRNMDVTPQAPDVDM